MPGRGVDQPFQSRVLYDALRSIPGGCHAGVDPQSIPRTKAAFLKNATVRGEFVTHRPSYRKITLSFADISLIGGATQALFQAACYHKAVTGIESLMAAVGGRLFQFAVSGTTATVTELTSPSLLQSGSAPQAWLWQSERFLIFQDGTNLPLFFDGNSTRRSLGNTPLTVGTTNATITTTSANQAVDISLAGPYIGPLGPPITISGHKFKINSVDVGAGTSGYKIDLKNIYGSTGESIASGTAIKLHDQFMAFSTIVAVPSGGQVVVPVNNIQYVGFNNVQVTGSGGNFTGKIIGIVPNGVSGYSEITIGNLSGSFTVAVGSMILTSPANNPTVATTSTAFTDPAVNATVTDVPITAAFTYPSNTVVYTGALSQSAKQFVITRYRVDSTVTYTAHAISTDGNLSLATPQNLVYQTTELPAGRMGTYGRGRNWMALTDGKHFIASDIVNGASGTAVYGFEDAVLSVTENDFLAGGGTFVVPGQVGDIRAMIFTAQLDTSQGQGPLAVLTPKVVFSCDAPVDRTTWQNLTNPILTESIKANGGLSHYGTINVNSDVIYRAIDGDRSYIIGRREFDKWGNVPISREVDFINSDNPQLLNFCSKIEFDNRALGTTGPVQANLGVYHTGLIALNNDPISSLEGKAPSVYDGLWDAPAGGVLQLVTGEFGGQTRAFAFCLSSDRSQIELWEILRTDDPFYQDDTGPIVWEIESASLNFYESDPRKRDFLTMTDGEMRVDLMNKTYGRNGAKITVAHQIKFEIFYKPDQDDSWTPWYDFTQTFDPNNPDDPGCRDALGFGEPNPLDTDPVNDSPMRTATTFQIKLRITGHCRLLVVRLKGHSEPTPDLEGPAQSN